MASYYNTDVLSDVVVACDGQEFKVHGVILSAHSKYFATALNGSWKESSEKKIKIKDFDASVVEAMLRFMYTFDYTNTYSTSTMVYDAQVYQIADKYDVLALKENSKAKFGVAITTGWSMDDFPLAITVVYESTPSADRGLRDLVVETSRKNIDKLLGHDGFMGVLLATGADPLTQQDTVRDDESSTPLSLAARLGNQRFLRMRWQYSNPGENLIDPYNLQICLFEAARYG
ncbi:hypothetical protein QQZ08_010673 [Neonectria magnoliae]|uniref:BTB domain-containing protein n=1 Tax=Neonectria magnoliae TaxID=2732573 RepID=A0ABR1HG67_9HYPO